MRVPLPPTPPAGARPRRMPRPVEVVAVKRISSRMVSITVAGDSLADFEPAFPTSHIKVFLPGEDGSAPVLPEHGPEGARPIDGGPRPLMRTYTPRRVHHPDHAVDIHFVLHGDGPAAAFAARAKVGDKLAIAGPGGRFPLDLRATRWFLAADESALPALCTLLEALPPDAEAQVHVEVEDPGAVIALPGPTPTVVEWHERGAGVYGDTLVAAARDAVLDGVTQAWAACEAVAVRRLRKVLTTEQGLALSAVATRGYWRDGESDHPDHDDGDD